MVMLGYEATIPVTLGDIIHHARAVSRVVKRPLVVADMPFLSYQSGLARAAANAGKLIQQGGAAAVKLEGGAAVFDVVERLVAIGIPVMGHLGLTPQAVHQLGGYQRQARGEADGEKLLADARGLEERGAFAIVLESIPEDLAAKVSAALAIPTIGIGAGPGCDGQVLVTQDMLGFYDSPPPFVKQYAKLGDAMVKAVERYVGDVRRSRFPKTG
jgi:3-methyl-2-oxobutanoate hydroxymethyltransferase